MTKEETKAYKRVREIARKSALGQEIPEDWRKILIYADEVMSCGEVMESAPYEVVEEHIHVYTCDYNKPLLTCECGKFYVDNTSKDRMVPKEETFSKELSGLLNKYSLENSSNTPDFMLAEYLIDCLASYNKITVWNNKWHSMDGVPVNERNEGPCLDRPNPTKHKTNDDPFQESYLSESQKVIDFLDRK
jgi:hypothetical protein